MLSLLRALALPAALLFAQPAAAHDGVMVADPYARFVNGSGVVYFRIDNHSDTDDRLIAAHSDLSMATLMTNVTDANGMMQMRDAMDGFAVDAMSSRLLQPAGDHVMLMQVTPEPTEGTTLTLILTFEHAGQVTLTVPVTNTRRTPPELDPTPYDVMSDQAD
jgi:periplasmic copper chaperone A